MANNTLQITNLDYNSLRNNIKTFLQSQSEFTDYNFEGSGLSVLLDILAYNTYYNSLYLHMAANEAFIDTAQIRQNVLSLAKALNYVPTSSRAAKSLVNIRVTPTTSENQSVTQLTLDKYTRLLGADVSGVNYPFVTLNSNTVVKIDGSFLFSNVYIHQGEVINQEYTMEANNTLARFEIPSSNVDTNTIVVNVQESIANTYTESYVLSTDITDISSGSRVYFVEENENLNYTVQFGDGILGYRPKNGNIIKISYLDTEGSIANNITKFGFIDPIGGLYRGNVSITTAQKSYGGTDKETLDQIRFRATQNYSSQNRCVTVNDYESLIAKEFNNIDAISVWGGEDNDPPVYGKVYISIKTKGFYELTNLEKENIKNALIREKNIVTVTPEIVDPNYVFLLVGGKVKYNPNLTNKTASQLNDIIKQAVYDYAENELKGFKATFRKSRLQQYIEQCDPSITGSSVNIYLQNRQDIDTSISKKYVIDFNTPIKRGTFTEKIYTFPQMNVLDSFGSIRGILYEEVPDSYTGIDYIDINNSGVNYTRANVVITGDGSGAKATATIVNGRIISINVTDKGIGYSQANVLIEGDGTEAAAVARLEAKNGVLRSYYYTNTGNKIIFNPSAGTVDYSIGRVSINNIKPIDLTTNNFYEKNVLTLNVVPDSEIIGPQRNRIISIDEDNIQSVQLEIIAER